MSELVWEDPPAHSGRMDWRAVAAELRDRPGEWARVRDGLNATYASVTATRIKKGVFKPFKPAGAFEAESRKHGDASAVWARYVGPAPEDRS